MIKYYGSSYVFTAIALVLGYILGGFPGVAIVAILGVLETSLSFDNAVVNASVLKNWDEQWRRRFLVWGLPVAVFGMRLIFPLAIVAITAHLSPFAALNLAIADPAQYESILKSVHHEVAAFGGVFLLMVFMDFFLQEEKDNHWIPFIEAPLAKVGKLGIEAGIALVVVMVASTFIGAAEQSAFVTAGVWGLVTYIAAKAVGTLAGGDDVANNVIKQGVGGFAYLELLDASFSFDGVIAAFALTNNVFVMMIGLSVGAMFVRSMTLHLVDKGTLNEYRYLEHSAFWAIGVLATIMFAGAAGLHIPEVVVGGMGAVIIGVGVAHSIIVNKRESIADKRNNMAC